MISIKIYVIHYRVWGVLGILSPRIPTFNNSAAVLSQCNAMQWTNMLIKQVCNGGSKTTDSCDSW